MNFGEVTGPRITLGEGSIIHPHARIVNSGTGSITLGVTFTNLIISERKHYQ
jgi:hypothetical protein